MFKRVSSHGMLVQIRTYYKQLFGKYLFVTNTISYVTLFGLGDALTQFIERRSSTEPGKRHDFKRTLCITIFAAFQGPVNHFWYLGLDKFIKDTVHRMVLKKLAADQCIFAPYACVSFYLGKSTAYVTIVIIKGNCCSYGSSVRALPQAFGSIGKYVQLRLSRCAVCKIIECLL